MWSQVALLTVAVGALGALGWIVWRAASAPAVAAQEQAEKKADAAEAHAEWLAQRPPEVKPGPPVIDRWLG